MSLETYAPDKVWATLNDHLDCCTFVLFAEEHDVEVCGRRATHWRQIEIYPAAEAVVDKYQAMVVQPSCAEHAEGVWK